MTKIEKIQVRVATYYGLVGTTQEEKIQWADVNLPSITMDIGIEDIYGYNLKAKKPRLFKKAVKEYLRIKNEKTKTQKTARTLENYQ